MTVKEAIAYLEDPFSLSLGLTVERRLKLHNKAVNMGIEALKAQIATDTNVGSNDLISRQAAIDERRYTFGNDEFSLEAAYHDCKLFFDGITDDDSFQKADTGLILYYANEIIYALHEALEGKDTNVLSNDLISRQAAIELIERMKPYHQDADDIAEMIANLPSAQHDLITKIQNGIKATDADDVYSCGMRNGMRWCISLIDDKDPLYENCPSAQPKEVIPHRNYKYLSDYWCECGWHLGKKGEVKYCSECGGKVNWDG